MARFGLVELAEWERRFPLLQIVWARFTWLLPSGPIWGKPIFLHA